MQSFVQKKKILRFGTKNVNFGARIIKHYCHIWNQRSRICLLTKFDANTKIFKFGTKISWVVYFWAGSWKIFCDIWNQYPQISLTAKFLEKTKTPKFGIKSALLGYFWARISRNYCHIWNQPPQTCLISELWRKTKMSKFGTENALRGCFLAKMPCLCILVEKFEKKFLSQLKSVPWNFSNCENSEKRKAA